MPEYHTRRSHPRTVIFSKNVDISSTDTGRIHTNKDFIIPFYFRFCYIPYLITL